MKLSIIIGVMLGILIGFVSSLYVNANQNYETPLSPVIDGEKLSPSDRIKEGQIHVYPDRVVIFVDNPQWASYTDTNSMDPLIDEGANGLEIVPKSPDEVSIGDIAAYESEYGLLIHRVVDKKLENNQYWYKFKGDNNTYDDGWVEFKKIKYVTWGIIY